MINKTNILLNLLNDKLIGYAVGNKMKLNNTSILLSFSGGIDSTVMASLMIILRIKYNFMLGFAHINHQVHDKSHTVENYCNQYSQDNDVVFHLKKLYFISKRNFESCARKKRYKILNDIAAKHSYDFILTAHHQDDQLETLYMKKMDGGDWISKIGIRECMGKLRRPLLEISKKDITVYAKQHHLEWIEDPTNQDMCIRRNNIRHHILPQAYHSDSGLKQSLLNMSNKYFYRLKYTLRILQEEHDDIINYHSDKYIKLNRNKLRGYNIEKLKLFIYISISSVLKINVPQQSGGLWREFYKFVKNSNTGALFKIDTLTFFINRDEIITINQYEKLKIPTKKRLCHNLIWFSGQFKTKDIGRLNLSSIKNKFVVPDSMYNDGLYIRSWHYGDYIVSATSQKHVSISDLYINCKLSQYDKLMQPVVVDEKDIICWIPGIIHGKVVCHKNEKIRVITWLEQ